MSCEHFDDDRCVKCFVARVQALQAMHDLIVWMWCNATSGNEVIGHWEGCAGADAIVQDLREQLANTLWAAGGDGM